MKKESNTLPQSYFDELYTNSSDPWDFEKSDYERQKYEKTLESLPQAHYNSCLEIGCSIGVLTQKLSGRCKKLLAIDISEPALATARKRLSNQQNVTIQKASIPDSFPAGDYDLIVMSEVGYYLSTNDLTLAKNLLKKNLTPNGDLILVHWTHEVADYPLSGDEVHELFLKEEDFIWLDSFRTADYRLDVLRKK